VDVTGKPPDASGDLLHQPCPIVTIWQLSGHGLMTSSCCPPLVGLLLASIRVIMRRGTSASHTKSCASGLAGHVRLLSAASKLGIESMAEILVSLLFFGALN
jgi:hypothetical protein